MRYAWMMLGFLIVAGGAMSGCTPNHGSHQQEGIAVSEGDRDEMKSVSDDIEATREVLQDVATTLQSGGDVDQEKLARLEQLLASTEETVEKLSARLDAAEAEGHEGHDHDGHDH